MRSTCCKRKIALLWLSLTEIFLWKHLQVERCSTKQAQTVAISTFIWDIFKLFSHQRKDPTDMFFSNISSLSYLSWWYAKYPLTRRACLTVINQIHCLIHSLIFSHEQCFYSLYIEYRPSSLNRFTPWLQRHYSFCRRFSPFHHCLAWSCGEQSPQIERPYGHFPRYMTRSWGRRLMGKWDRIYSQIWWGYQGGENWRETHLLTDVRQGQSCWFEILRFLFSAQFFKSFEWRKIRIS